MSLRRESENSMERSILETSLLSDLLNMAEAMLVSGSEVSRVEDTVTRMGLAYGAAEIHAFVITSCIIITMVTTEGKEMTQTRRITVAGGTDFMKLEQFNDLSRRCCGGQVPQEHISQEVEKIACQQPNRAKIYLGSVLAASGFAMFFGGAPIDAIMTSLFAVLICYLQEKLLPICMNQMAFNMISSLMVGTLIGIYVRLYPGLQMDKIMIGCVMLLIPGVALTNAVRNILMGNTISGVMRLIEAFLWAAALAGGFMIALFITGGAYV